MTTSAVTTNSSSCQDWRQGLEAEVPGTHLGTDEKLSTLLEAAAGGKLSAIERVARGQSGYPFTIDISQLKNGSSRATLNQAFSCASPTARSGLDQMAEKLIAADTNDDGRVSREELTQYWDRSNPGQQKTDLPSFQSNLTVFRSSADIMMNLLAPYSLSNPMTPEEIGQLWGILKFYADQWKIDPTKTVYNLPLSDFTNPTEGALPDLIQRGLTGQLKPWEKATIRQLLDDKKSIPFSPEEIEDLHFLMEKAEEKGTPFEVSRSQLIPMVLQDRLTPKEVAALRDWMGKQELSTGEKIQRGAANARASGRGRFGSEFADPVLSLVENPLETSLMLGFSYVVFSDASAVYDRLIGNPLSKRLFSSQLNKACQGGLTQEVVEAAWMRFQAWHTGARLARAARTLSTFYLFQKGASFVSDDKHKLLESFLPADFVTNPVVEMLTDAPLIIPFGAAEGAADYFLLKRFGKFISENQDLCKAPSLDEPLTEPVTVPVTDAVPAETAARMALLMGAFVTAGVIALSDGPSPVMKPVAGLYALGAITLFLMNRETHHAL